MLERLVRYVREHPGFRTLMEGLAERAEEQWVTGLTGTAAHLMMAALRRETGKPILIVTHHLQEAQQVYDDCLEFLPDDRILLFPEREAALLDVSAYSPELAAQRMGVLSQLAKGETPLLIAPARAVDQPLPDLEIFRSFLLHLKTGDVMEREQLVDRLLQMGYEQAEMVEARGECAVRGGIVDVYPLTEERAFRIEFFDDEIDAIRVFDPESQRSIEQVTECEIGPNTEVLASKERIQAVARVVRTGWERQREKFVDEGHRERLDRYVGEDVRRLESGYPFTGLLRYIHLLYPRPAGLLSWLPEDTLCVYAEPTRIRESLKQRQREEHEWELHGLEKGELLPGLHRPQTVGDAGLSSHRQRILFSLLARHTSPTRRTVAVAARSMQQFHGQMNVLKQEWERWSRTGQRVILVAANAERAERLHRVLGDYGMEADLVSELSDRPVRPQIVQGGLSSGFEMPDLKLVVVTEQEIFTAKRRHRRVSTVSDVERIKNYQDLKVGDYVVHVNHGIGQYMGIQTLDIEGIHKDYLYIRYAGNDKLYVPIDQIDQVQKYVGGEDKEPKLYHLGGTEWAKVKNRVRSSVRDIAEELVKLYAKRMSSPGHAFSPDTPWQKEFEAMFPYRETPDQLKAIEEIKRDMEQPRPMDRLLCGDVGYGKTEVAMRAAFKAVMDGKQVAVLVPTTVLAQQHYETFRERFSGFPITIDVISRFRTRGEMTQVLKQLRAGTVDIIIGTHRLLQKDVKFKDLGLLIVDEEQRFGVSHKERLKQLKTNVDCLTLTATPIPRTLHMSMLGVRDLSIIETPPENRFPVQTYVLEYDDLLAKEAIEREMGRGGQVYFLFNKVQGIEQMADRVRRLVPEARVAVAHGQMPEDDLERVMLEFLHGEHDVLVTTTIIETGLDIPNVNTLIVYDADHLGLSQLYQLRGRVGRSNRIAYAYFTYQPEKVLTEVAEKRLQAIKEFTELGSGFKIALRDLSIRGAGNLLGPEQHGFIASVGFDLYSEMLAEAIQDLKGEPTPKVVEPQVELAVDAYLPERYIPDSMQKIEIYKKFVTCHRLEDVDDLEEEIEDRFGDIPQEVANLLSVTRIKMWAIRYDFKSIVQQGTDVILKLHERQNKNIQGDRLFDVTKRFRDRIKLTAGQNIAVTFRMRGLTGEQSLALLLEFMEAFQDVVKGQEELQNVL
ncbi:MAG: transcription-repair coupling factor [Kyrpidia sp.]|nr:transcription-repair coupling factor [Kyrpidia sp.]